MPLGGSGTVSIQAPYHGVNLRKKSLAAYHLCSIGAYFCYLVVFQAGQVCDGICKFDTVIRPNLSRFSTEKAVFCTELVGGLAGVVAFNFCPPRLHKTQKVAPSICAVASIGEPVIGEPTSNAADQRENEAKHRFKCNSCPWILVFVTSFLIGAGAYSHGRSTERRFQSNRAITSSKSQT